MAVYDASDALLARYRAIVESKVLAQLRPPNAVAIERVHVETGAGLVEYILDANSLAHVPRLRELVGRPTKDADYMLESGHVGLQQVVAGDTAAKVGAHRQMTVAVLTLPLPRRGQPRAATLTCRVVTHLLLAVLVLGVLTVLVQWGLESAVPPSGFNADGTDQQLY